MCADEHGKRAAEAFVLIYEAMPNLSAAEIKVLLVVCRATLAVDLQEASLLRAEIEAETGLSHVAVIRATKALIDAKLIERRHAGHKQPYVYRVHPQALRKHVLRDVA